MLRKEQKPFLVRYLPEFLCWAAALSALYVCGAWTFKPIREHNETSREAYKSGTNPYYTASALYAAGDIDAAAETLKPLLQKSPPGMQPNILMAKIELSRRQPAAAIKHLEAARETALDRKEIDTWIADLKSRLSSPQ